MANIFLRERNPGDVVAEVPMVRQADSYYPSPVQRQILASPPAPSMRREVAKLRVLKGRAPSAPNPPAIYETYFGAGPAGGNPYGPFMPDEPRQRSRPAPTRGILRDIAAGGAAGLQGAAIGAGQLADDISGGRFRRRLQRAEKARRASIPDSTAGRVAAFVGREIPYLLVGAKLKTARAALGLGVGEAAAQPKAEGGGRVIDALKAGPAVALSTALASLPARYVIGKQLLAAAEKPGMARAVPPARAGALVAPHLKAIENKAGLAGSAYTKEAMQHLARAAQNTPAGVLDLALAHQASGKLTKKRADIVGGVVGEFRRGGYYLPPQAASGPLREAALDTLSRIRITPKYLQRGQEPGNPVARVIEAVGADPAAVGRRLSRADLRAQSGRFAGAQGPIAALVGGVPGNEESNAAAQRLARRAAKNVAYNLGVQPIRNQRGPGRRPLAQSPARRPVDRDN